MKRSDMSRYFFVLFVSLFVSAQAHAQSAKEAVSATLLDNPQVRVIDMRFAPGARSGSLSHPNRFLYALTDGSLVFSPPGRTPYELSFKNGETLWLPAQEIASANDTAKEIHVLVVELKAAPLRTKPKSPRKGKAAPKTAAVKPAAKPATPNAKK